MGGWGRLFWPPTDPLVFFLVDFSDARRGFLCVCRCVCFRTFTKKKEKKISSATKHLVAEQQVFQSQSC